MATRLLINNLLKFSRITAPRSILDLPRSILGVLNQSLYHSTDHCWCFGHNFLLEAQIGGSVKVEGLILDMNMLKKNNIPATNIHYRSKIFRCPKYLAWTNPMDEFLETDAFKGMRNLRLLKLSYVELRGTYAIFPKKIRWLHLRGFRWRSLPKEFPLENIVSLKIRNSSLEHIWNVTKVLESLKILNLSHSLQLVETPHFSNIPNLEKLVLKNCPSLVEVDESLTTLQRLLVLNLKDCKSLRNLPKNISMVQSLEELIVSGCSNLVGVADELVKLKSLKVFRAYETNMNQLLFTGHEVEVAPRHALYFSNWITKPNKNPKTLSFVSLPRSLVTLSLVRCNLSDDAFLHDFGSLPMLQNLFLGGNPIRSLPHFIRYLTGLKKLDISASPGLQQISFPPITVEEMIISNCRELKQITYESLHTIQSIKHFNCVNLSYSQNYFKIEPIRKVDIKVLRNLGFSELKSMASAEALIESRIVWSKKKCPIQFTISTFNCGRLSKLNMVLIDSHLDPTPAPPLHPSPLTRLCMRNTYSLYIIPGEKFHTGLMSCPQDLQFVLLFLHFRISKFGA
ncbi:hypothetical protein LguiB_005377 [Lonicera macranthoides]